MRILSFLLATATSITMAPSAWANSPFLPISATNTFSSGERTIVENAIHQAESEGKLVLIDMAAAWCGPCMALEKSEEDNKATLAPTLAHFVPVKLEEMFLEGLSGADFIPTEIPWFPSLFVYNPTSQKWTMLYADDAVTLKQNLDDYLAHQGLADFYWQGVSAKLASGAAVTDVDLMSALLPLAFEKPGAELLSATTQITKAMTAHPDRFAFSITDMETELNDVYMRAIELNKLTFEQIRAADPLSLAELATTPSLYTRILFNAPLGILVRTQGNKAASDQCITLAAKTADAMKGASTEDQRKAQVGRDLQCLLLKVQVKEQTAADVLAYEATMTDVEKSGGSSYSLAKVFAQAGNFNKATSYAKIWQAMYLKALAKRAELLARVQLATDARLAAYAAGKTHP